MTLTRIRVHAGLLRWLLCVALTLTLMPLSPVMAQPATDNRPTQPSQPEQPKPVEDAYPATGTKLQVVRVAVLPVLLLQPAGRQSLALAASYEELLTYYLDAVHFFEVVPSRDVCNALVPFDYSSGPSVELAADVARRVGAEYVLCSTLRYGASEVQFASWWCRNGAVAGQREWRETMSAASPLGRMRIMARDVVLSFVGGDVSKLTPNEAAQVKSPVVRYPLTLTALGEATVALRGEDWAAAERALEADSVKAELTASRVAIKLAKIALHKAMGQAAPNAEAAKGLAAARALLAESRQALATAKWVDWRVDYVDGLVALEWARHEPAKRVEACMAAETALLAVLKVKANHFASWDLLLNTVKPALLAERYPTDRMPGEQKLTQAAIALMRDFQREPMASVVASKVALNVNKPEMAADWLKPVQMRSPLAAEHYAAVLELQGKLTPAFTVYKGLGTFGDKALYHARIFAVRARMLFEARDKNNSKLIEKEELPGAYTVAFASADQNTDGKLDFNEWIRFLPSAGQGPFAGLTEKIDEFEAHADELWREALQAAALSETSTDGRAQPGMAEVEMFLSTATAKERMAKLRVSYESFLEIQLPQERAYNLTEYVLASWYLARVANDQVQMAAKARNLAQRGVRANAIALALDPKASPKERFAPKNVGNDKPFSDDE